MSNRPNSEIWEEEVSTSSIDQSSHYNRYGERHGRKSMFQGLWSRIDVKYMRPLFGGSRAGSPDLRRLGVAGNTNALNDIATGCTDEDKSLLIH